MVVLDTRKLKLVNGVFVEDEQKDAKKADKKEEKKE